MSYTYVLNTVSEFVDPKRKYRILKPVHLGAGMFSYIWVVLQSIYEHPNEKYYIDWTKFTPYYDPETIKHTDNVWEYYFEQPDIKTIPPYDEIIAVGIWNGGESGYCHLCDISEQKRLKYAEIINQYVKPLPHISQKLQSFEDKHSLKTQRVLGVHCRGVSGAFDGAHKTSTDFYINQVGELEKDYDVIFVISDEFSYIESLLKKFGSKVVYYEDAIRETLDRKDMILLPGDDHKLKNKYKQGEDVIIDSFLLSNASFIICPYSNVSTFSHFKNPNSQFLDVDIKLGHVKK
jgi:hypothetical protein